MDSQGAHAPPFGAEPHSDQYHSSSPSLSHFFDQAFGQPTQSTQYPLPSLFQINPSVAEGPSFPLQLPLASAEPSASLSGYEIAISQSSQPSLVVNDFQLDPILLYSPPAGNRHPAARRSRYTRSNWEAHYAQIKSIYIEADESLEYTMKFMKEKFQFSPSQKMYKEKFKEWGWSKKLPSSLGHWMLMKAEQRRRQDGKGTFFQQGNRLWTVPHVQKRIQRAGSQRNEVIPENAPTPHGITYQTPGNALPSPHNILSPTMSKSQLNGWTPIPKSQARRLHQLSLTWNGHTRQSIDSMYHEAQKLDRQGSIQEAEDKFRESLAGLENLLSSTHEDTNAIAYRLAAFYARHDRMDDADAVLSWMGEKHLERWGLDNRKTIEHVLHVVDLYDSWSRTEDAIGFLCRLHDVFDRLVQKHDRSKDMSSGRTAQNSQPQPSSWRGTVRSAPMIEDSRLAFSLTELTEEDAELVLANAFVKDTNEEAEPVLLRLIRKYEKHPDRLSVQILGARRALLDLYRGLGRDNDFVTALGHSEASFWEALNLDIKKTRAVLEAATEIAAVYVDAERFETAEDMFLKIESEAVESFGADDKVLICILIDIGKIYQAAQRWSDAQPRFEHALAASMTCYRLEGKTTKALEAGLENEFYEVAAMTNEEYEQRIRENGLPSPLAR